MKRWVWLIPALLLAALCWLRPGLRLSVNGERMEGAISPSAALRGLRAAEEAAAELQQGEEAPPALRLLPALTLAPPSEDAAAAADFVLRRTAGVVVREGCRADGIWLGCTDEGDRLREALRRHIFGTRPPGALSGHFSGQVEHGHDPGDLYRRRGRRGAGMTDKRNAGAGLRPPLRSPRSQYRHSRERVAAPKNIQARKLFLPLKSE